MSPGDVTLDLSLKRPADMSDDFIGPVVPTKLISPTVPTQLISPTVPTKLISPINPTKLISPMVPTQLISPNKKTRTVRTPKDVTKSKRYQNSLSFLLGSMGGSDKDEGEKNFNKKEEFGSVKPETRKICPENPNTVPMVTESTYSKRLHLEKTKPISGVCLRKQTNTDCNTSTTPGTKSTHPHQSKRPCPFRFKQPTLKKTTSALFAQTSNNYLKGCKWSPDGLSLLTCSRDKRVRIFNIPDVASTAEQVPVAEHSTANIVNDFCWNPKVDHMSAKNCNFLLTCKESPIHAVNSFTGQTMASYTAFDAMDVLISAFSVCYMTPQSLIGGYCKHVRVFDMTRPGRDSTKLTVGDKMHQNNNSIVATLDKHPGIENVFGAGCYNATVALYSTQMEGPLMSFSGPDHGVTQVMFSQDGTRLYCGSRMEDDIFCFDTRYNGNVLRTFKRSVLTNQRIQFDINKSESLMASGNHDGSVSLYDLTKPPGDSVEEDNAGCLQFKAHKDTVNSVSFHPFWGLVATASGRRHFHIEDNDIEENSLKIWSFSDS